MQPAVPESESGQPHGPPRGHGLLFPANPTWPRAVRKMPWPWLLPWPWPWPWLGHPAGHLTSPCLTHVHIHIYTPAHLRTAEAEGELTVSKGQMVQLAAPEDPNNDGWLTCRLSTGQVGYVPSDFVAAQPGGGAALAPAPVPPPAPAVQAVQVPAALGSDPFAASTAADPFSYPPPQAQAQAQPPPPALGAADPFSAPYGGPSRPAAQGRMSVAVPPAMASSDPFAAPPPPPAVAAAPAAPQPDMAKWAARDAAYGSARMPIPPLRRWFYKDIFNDTQGPFDPSEMKQRLDAKHIGADNMVLIEVGSGAVAKYEERTVRTLYPDATKAFMQAPVLDVSDPNAQCWYFLDESNREQGPFSSEQMRLWFDNGYFASDSRVRSASGTTAFTSLAYVFPDPQLSFITTPNFTGAQANLAPPAAAAAATWGPAQTKPAPMEKYGSVGFLAGAGARGGQSAGRDLLFSAMSSDSEKAAAAAAGGAGGGPPPAIGSANHQDEEDEHIADEANDEGDAEAVHLGGDDDDDTGGGKDKKASKKKKKYIEPDVVVYGSGWGPAKPIPNIKANSQNYATLLYTWLTRPLNPEHKTVQCYIRRDIDGSHLNFNKYVVYLEEGNVPIMAAFRHHHTVHSYYDVKMITTAEARDAPRGLTIAQLELNFMGTQFLLHNSVTGHQGRPRDLACVIYESNRLGNKGPRKMRVGIPEINEKGEYFQWQHQGNKNPQIVQSLKALNVDQLIPLLNKPPKWNASKHAYMLDFHGRVTRASVKNFQLCDALKDPNHDNVVLQHGRVASNKFTMDLRHPFSPLQAFAVCLSSLHAKRYVSACFIRRVSHLPQQNRRLDCTQQGFHHATHICTTDPWTEPRPLLCALFLNFPGVVQRPW